jgi:hypothetical protein
MGSGPLELGISAAFFPDKIIILKHFCENALYFNKNMTNFLFKFKHFVIIANI